jgi:uncharacterized protein
MPVPSSFLVKPASSDCNLFCDYCFYRKTAASYPETAAHRMTVDTLDALVRKAQGGRAPAVNWCWQGGEPLLMGLDFYRTARELQERYRPEGSAVANAVQTNGVLVDREWARFFREHSFLVGVSLDGPRELHDLHRPNRAGSGVFDRVTEAVDILRDEGVEYSILSVVNDDTARHAADIYGFFREQGYASLQFIPCVEAGSGEIPPFAVKPPDYAAFLSELFDLWLADGYPRVDIRFFTNAVQFFIGLESECCMFRPACTEYLVVEHNGDVYPCDFFVEDGWRVGNIVRDSLDEIASHPKLAGFSGLRSIPRDECERCRWLDFCHRGCVRFRWIGGHDYTGRDYLCDAHRAFLDANEDRLWFLSYDVRRRNLYLPAPDIGRNDPCVCGSGKKYKKCCEKYAFVFKK